GIGIAAGRVRRDIGECGSYAELIDEKRGTILPGDADRIEVEVRGLDRSIRLRRNRGERRIDEGFYFIRRASALGEVEDDQVSGVEDPLQGIYVGRGHRVPEGDR